MSLIYRDIRRLRNMTAAAQPTSTTYIAKAAWEASTFDRGYLSFDVGQVFTILAHPLSYISQSVSQSVSQTVSQIVSHNIISQSVSQSVI